MLKFRSVNETLQDVFQVLRCEIVRQPWVLGGSVFGMNDTYCRLQPVLRRWRAARVQAGALAAAEPVPRAFLATMDVSRAFDNMNAEAVVRLVAGLLTSQRYSMVQYTEITPRAGGSLTVRSRRCALPADDPAGPGPGPGAGHTHVLWSGLGAGRGVQTGGVVGTVTRQSVLALLSQHLQCNLVRLRRRWHAQARGVPQGSTLSTLLCCMYLAHAEAAALEEAAAARGRLTLLARAARCEGGPASQAAEASIGSRLGEAVPAGVGVSGCQGEATSVSGSCTNRGTPVLARRPRDNTPPSPLAPPGNRDPTTPAPPERPLLLLLRQMDDFLLLSSEGAVAEAFVERLAVGFPDLGIAVNSLKTRTSWGGGERLVRSRCGAAFLPWCGLLLNVTSLGVQGDYTRYHGDQVRWSVGAALPTKTVGFLRPKAHPLLLDARLNGRETVALNIFQAFCLAAMKVHVYIRALATPPAPALLARAVEEGIAFVVRAAGPRRVAPVFPTAPPVRCSSRTPPAHVRFLGLAAFRRVLGRKQSGYAALLAWIDAEMDSPGLRSAAQLLQPVIHPDRSSILDAILY